MRILVVAPAWVGDMVMAHCLVSVLGRQGNVTVDMLAPPATAPLGARMPGVADTLTLEVGHGELGWGARRAMARTVASRSYDQAIVLPNTFKSALVPFWAGIPRRTGWTGESRLVVLNDRRTLDTDRYPLMIERFMALGLPPGAVLSRPYPLPRLLTDDERAGVLMEEHGLTPGDVTVMCPGAEFGPAKRWPVAHYASVAGHELRRGRQVWLLGSAGDLAVCREIEALAPGIENLAGRTGLVDAVDLIGRADRVVCNDSGLMHVAAALDRHVVALFGSTSPDFTPPLGPKSRVIRTGIDCSPCFERQCPLGHFRCLADLAPERVMEVL